MDYQFFVGMLLYASFNISPDISYAMSRVARFTHQQKKSHTTTLKTIAKCYANTKDKAILSNLLMITSQNAT